MEKIKEGNSPYNKENLPGQPMSIYARVGERPTPCTEFTQRVQIGRRLGNALDDNLPIIENQYYAELSMLPINGSKSRLLDRMLDEHIVKLKEFEDWVFIRLAGINDIADRLIETAQQVMSANEDDTEESDGAILLYKHQTWEQFNKSIGTELIQYTKAYALSAQIDWLLTMYHDTDESITPKKTSSKGKLTQAQRALFYVYLHTTQSEPDFSTHPEGKTGAIRAVADAHLISAKNFEMTYNRLIKFSERTSKSMVTTIEAVIDMLEDYPEAQRKAEEELKIASMK